uniref:Uncharacterized protein n=1 Tax=Caenorhabditis tropicalis TaxID=1561998 RepID=A0A1I7UWN5_9PELO
MSRFALIFLAVFLSTVICEQDQETNYKLSLSQENPIGSWIRAKRQWGCGGCDCWGCCATLAPGATPAPCDCGCCGCGWGK